MKTETAAAAVDGGGAAVMVMVSRPPLLPLVYRYAGVVMSVWLEKREREAEEARGQQL